jgi:hypothetical protein
MISQLAGFTLTRSLPDKALIGVLTGAYKIYGGVIRDNAGHIVAHLVNGASSLSLLNPVAAIATGALSAVNTYQLHKIGKDIHVLQDSVSALGVSVSALQDATTQIVGLAKGTMVLSGLTLTVSAASFYFLNKKLSKIDERLTHIAKDVKEIKEFLESQERAQLAAALSNLLGITNELDSNTRTHLLVSSRQALGVVHQRYRGQLKKAATLNALLSIEEYFSITALSHALCSAELDMHTQAYDELKQAHQVWRTEARRVCVDVVLGDEPERFLDCRYANAVKTDELFDWLDFSYETEKELGWIDELRNKPTWWPDRHRDLTDVEKGEIEAMKKLVARNRVYEGYISQYSLLAAQQNRPSAVQSYFNSIPDSEKVDDCLVFVNQAEL